MPREVATEALADAVERIFALVLGRLIEVDIMTHCIAQACFSGIG
ncbi:MAG: hypothetical protein ACLUCF_06440 [Bifidobacterium breve]